MPRDALIRERLPFDAGRNIRSNYYYRNISGSIKLLFSERITRVSLLFLLGVLFIGIIGPWLAPHHYATNFFEPDGSTKFLYPPLTDGHIVGTTNTGQDIFSRLLYGTQPTVIIGLGGGTMIITIGTFMGVTSGYLGGRYESIMMRIVDFVYGVPLIPFAVVLLVFFRIGLWTTIFVIGIVLWRGSARVLRSQVLQIKERPYIQAVKATGASTPHIILKHIIPNIASMIVLFFAVGIGASILVQANLAFIGVSDPFVPTWGVIVRNAYNSGTMQNAWWWALPPGFLIGLTVLCTFLLGRGYENISSRDSIGDVETDEGTVAI